VSSRDHIVGVVLAAGQSRRMGRPKALLQCGPGGETFVIRLIRALVEAGIRDVVIVSRPHDAALAAAVAEEPAATLIENPDPDRGQLSSLQSGIAEAERRGAAGVLVIPVDIPMVQAATIARAATVFKASVAPIVRVTHQGRHGHPVLFAAHLFDELRRADPAVGAKAVLASHAADLLNLEVDDPGVLRDVDEPADYRALFGQSLIEADRRD